METGWRYRAWAFPAAKVRGMRQMEFLYGLPEGICELVVFY